MLAEVQLMFQFRFERSVPQNMSPLSRLEEWPSCQWWRFGVIFEPVGEKGR